MFIKDISLLWKAFNALVEVVGWLMIAVVIITVIITFVAWMKGILKPLWRLGLGLSRKKITVIASQKDSESLVNLIKSSHIFTTKNIFKIISKEDSEDIKRSNVILFKYSGAPFTLKQVLKKKHDDSAIVIYAKPGEIQNSEDWKLMDEYRNISVCNLKGRLLNDLLTLMMTTKL